MMVTKKKRKRNHSLLLLLTLFLTSCASNIEVLTPSSLFIYPESKGEIAKGTLNVHHMHGSLLEIGLDKTSAEADLSTKRAQMAFGTTAILGLADKIDLYATAGTHAPRILGAKIQFYGENFQNTHSNNISLALNLGFGQNNYVGSGNQNFNLELSSAAYELNRTHTTVQMGLLAGWRYEQYILIYTGLIKLTENIHGEIDYAGSPIDGKTIDIDGNHMLYNIGWLYEYDVYKLTAEYAIQQMHWEGDNKKNIQSFNLGVGVDF